MCGKTTIISSVSAKSEPKIFSFLVLIGVLRRRHLHSPRYCLRRNAIAVAHVILQGICSRRRSVDGPGNNDLLGQRLIVLVDCGVAGSTYAPWLSGQMSG